MEIRIRSLRHDEVPAADRILRLAFGTFLGVSDPTQTFGDSDFAFTRYGAAPDAALAAEADGKLVGSNFVTNWGSFGFFGPLSVEPKLWEQKVAQRLLEPTMEMFKKWGCRHTGLFTFSHSPKHAALYQKFGYWARFLTPVMSKQPSVSNGTSYTCFSNLPDRSGPNHPICRGSQRVDSCAASSSSRSTPHLPDSNLVEQHSEGQLPF
jgi:predicted N-acetyltransferase YhbS